MASITIPKNEYVRLQRQASAYRKLTSRLFETVIKDPIKETIEDFGRTNLYTKEFLRDLEKGLRKSSYAKSKA